MAKRASAEVRSIADELVRLRGAKHIEHSVAWPVSEGVRFIAILVSGNPPLVGIVLPTIMPRVSHHLALLGMPQPGDVRFGPHPFGAEFWAFVPAVFLPPPWLSEMPNPDASLRIDEKAEADPPRIARLVDMVLRAESASRPIMGSIRDVLDYGRNGPLSPRTSPFVAPAAYYALGRVQDAEDCIAEGQDVLAANPATAELFSQFVANLRDEHGRAES